MATNQTKETKQEKQPILRAKYIKPDLKKMVGKVLSYIGIFAFLSLVLSTVTGSGDIFGQVINILLLSCYFLLELLEGASRGEHDVAMSFAVQERMNKNIPPEKNELARCYSPFKAFAAFGISVGVLFAMAVIVALSAKPYTYTLQDLPTWMSAYMGRSDISEPLGYYTVTYGATVVDYLRIVVRACILPFVNLFPDAAAASMIIDRLSPLFIIVLPLTYPIGYLFGPKMYEKRLRDNAAAKKATLKRIRKKNKKERMQRMNGNVIREKDLQSRREQKIEQKREQRRKDNQLV